MDIFWEQKEEGCQYGLPFFVSVQNIFNIEHFQEGIYYAADAFATILVISK